jgi:23S rRNA (cytidine1920-2'-O)/16S rRNA (cytidine1409-2'-O)-methyltransferase
VDVGHGQLHQRLRNDPLVTNLERLDIREVTLATVGGSPVDLVTADLSFISVSRALPALVGEAVAPGAPMVILVKPQFEAGRVEASRGKGVIRDPAIHRRTLGEVADALDAAGAVIMGAMPSPITGSAGNVEFLLHACAPAATVGGRDRSGTTADVRSLLDAAVGEAHHRPANPGRE